MYEAAFCVLPSSRIGSRGGQGIRGKDSTYRQIEHARLLCGAEVLSLCYLGVRVQLYPQYVSISL